MAARSITIVGTQIKFALSLSLPGGLTMDEVDFSATFYTVTNRCVAIGKGDMSRQDDGTYVCVVDTGTLGAGRIKCEVEALLPDSSMPDGKRKEVVFIDTGEDIRYGLHKR